MVKKIITPLFILFIFNCLAQKKQDLWWLQTPSNKKYEENYKYALSEIGNGELKQQIKKFIKTYLSHKSKEDIAIEITAMFSNKRDEKKYNITYLSNYYNLISFDHNIQQIAEIEGKMILIKDANLKDFKVNKEILYGLLRDKFPDISKENNISYSKDGSFSELWLLEHERPNWIFAIKDGKLIGEKIKFE